MLESFVYESIIPFVKVNSCSIIVILDLFVEIVICSSEKDVRSNAPATSSACTLRLLKRVWDLSLSS